jgi:hypothetical protein
MFLDEGPLSNLPPEHAERIAREGFQNILGWTLENPVIPERIVLRTGGHPSFVQYFCRQIQLRVAQRDDETVKLEDIEHVFADDHPNESFIAHVRSTLKMNLKAVERYLIIWLAFLHSEAQSFTRAQMRDIFQSSGITIEEDGMNRALERLQVTSVVKLISPEVYQFSVPDYPRILYRLGDTQHMDSLTQDLKEFLANPSIEE